MSGSDLLQTIVHRAQRQFRLITIAAQVTEINLFHLRRDDLFGDLSATARLDITALTFPPEIEQARKRGRKIASSYYIEATVAPRGAYTYDLTSRTKAHESAVRREYAELFGADGQLIRNARSPAPPLGADDILENLLLVSESDVPARHFRSHQGHEIVRPHCAVEKRRT